jgi:hypothetical protein
MAKFNKESFFYAKHNSVTVVVHAIQMTEITSTALSLFQRTTKYSPSTSMQK